MKRILILALGALTVVSIVAGGLKSTPDVGAGPNHRRGAPYRAKLSPPLAEGTVLLVSGTVRDGGTGEGISGVVLEAYQADARGQYDLDGFDYRARMLTDERGRYEFETIHPANYGPPPHIHFVVTHPDYAVLKTELFFAPDLEESGETRPPAALVTELVRHEVDGAFWEEGTFDIVLRRR